jgi:hypothetical protein
LQHIEIKQSALDYTDMKKPVIKDFYPTLKEIIEINRRSGEGGILVNKGDFRKTA